LHAMHELDQLDGRAHETIGRPDDEHAARPELRHAFESAPQARRIALPPGGVPGDVVEKLPAIYPPARLHHARQQAVEVPLHILLRLIGGTAIVTDRREGHDPPGTSSEMA